MVLLDPSHPAVPKVPTEWGHFHRYQYHSMNVRLRGLPADACTGLCKVALWT